MRSRKMTINKTRIGAFLCSMIFAIAGCEVSVDTETEVAAPAVEMDDIPRTPSGRPDFNGIWQALGNAHWDIEAHMAGPALAL